MAKNCNPTIALTVAQLRQAMYFATGGSDVTPDDLATKLKFQVCPGEGVENGSQGVHCWLVEHPEDEPFYLNEQADSDVIYELKELLEARKSA